MTLAAALGFLLVAEAAGALTRRRSSNVSAPAQWAAALLVGLGLFMLAGLLLPLLPPAAQTPLFWIGGLVVFGVRWGWAERPSVRFPQRYLLAALVLAAGGVAYAKICWAGPLDTLDFRTHFGLRARHVLLSGVGPAALLDRWRSPWHGFYPPGLSLLYVVAAIARGRFDEQFLVIVPAAAALIVLLAFLGNLVDARVPPAPATLWAAVIAVLPGLWARTEVGHAEVPLAAALAVGVAAIIRGGESGALDLRWAAAMAAFLKNEGLPLAVLLLGADAVLAAPAARRKRLFLHASALTPALLWMALAKNAGFPRDIGRLLPALSDWAMIGGRLSGVLQMLGQVSVLSVSGPICLGLPLVIGFALWRPTPETRRAAVVAAALLAQIAVLTWTYLVTPYHVFWLMWLSIERVLAPIALGAAMTLAVFAGAAGEALEERVPDEVRSTKMT